MGLFAITGAGSGIGAATRARLEKAGHSVVGIDLKNAEVIADLSTGEGRSAAIKAVVDQSKGSLDGLLTAAGVGPPFRIQNLNRSIRSPIAVRFERMYRTSSLKVQCRSSR